MPFEALPFWPVALHECALACTDSLGMFACSAVGPRQSLSQHWGGSSVKVWHAAGTECAVAVDRLLHVSRVSVGYSQ